MREAPSLLLVDDDKLLLSAMVRLFTQAGYTTLAAQDGPEALTLARAEKPDLILLDVNLLTTNGMDVCRQIKADPQLTGIFVVLLSGTRTDSDSQVQGLEGGADGYITRPVTNQELLARIGGLLRIKHSEDKLRASEERLQIYAEKLEEMVTQRTEQLRIAQEQLIRREKLAVLGQMAGGVGHELRQPLTIIANACYFLKTTQPDAAPITHEYLDIIQMEVRNASQIIAELLDFARTRTPQKERVSAADLVAQSLQKLSAPQSVVVISHFPPNLPDLFVDPQQIGQALVNLILNAYQAMPEGGTLSLSAVEQSPAMLNIYITDTGPGIPIENQHQLFEPLFTTKPKGVGLGLVVTKLLLEANNGSIHLESAAGQGATFILGLPIDQDLGTEEKP